MQKSRLRRRGAPRRPLLPHRTVLQSVLQQAHRRVRRQLREPHAVRRRDHRRHPGGPRQGIPPVGANQRRRDDAPGSRHPYPRGRSSDREIPRGEGNRRPEREQRKRPQRQRQLRPLFLRAGLEEARGEGLQTGPEDSHNRHEHHQGPRFCRVAPGRRSVRFRGPGTVPVRRPRLHEEGEGGPGG
ncbi:hypothetical protein SDC9_110065 [bioreactor metagenome]|uniref:Uncharacterized protein n=1 Tax=bioreactor metagenome TaxID=1076179 RepID=A0A645BCL1_9ZZZZ